MRRTMPALFLAAALVGAPSARADTVLDTLQAALHTLAGLATQVPAAPAGNTALPPDIISRPAEARARLLPLLRAEALRQGVPPALADAVAMNETGYTESAVGTSGEIGLMQILPTTAASLGFAGSSTDLFKAATNIHYGVAYLARTWAASGGNACRALMKYRAGLNEEGYSPLSLQYCQRAAAWLQSQDQTLAANVTRNTPAVATLTDPNVVSMGGGHAFHFDPAALAEAAGGQPLVVERLPAAWHVSRRASGHIDIKPVLEAAESLDTDPHVIHIPAPP